MDFMLVSAWRGCQDLAILGVLRTRPVQKPSSPTSPRDVGIDGPIFPLCVSAKFMLVKTAERRIHVPFKLLFGIPKHTRCSGCIWLHLLLTSFFLPNPY